MKPAHVKNMPLLKRLNSSAIQTTLYELLETVIDVAGPEDGKLINEVTIGILKKAKPSIRVNTL